MILGTIMISRTWSRYLFHCLEIIMNVY